MMGLPLFLTVGLLGTPHCCCILYRENWCVPGLRACNAWDFDWAHISMSYCSCFAKLSWSTLRFEKPLVVYTFPYTGLPPSLALIGSSVLLSFALTPLRGLYTLAWLDNLCCLISMFRGRLRCEICLDSDYLSCIDDRGMLVSVSCNALVKFACYLSLLCFYCGLCRRFMFYTLL